MKAALSNIIIFATGAAIGSVVTWKLVKTKYEQIANEEIQEVRELYAQKVDELTHSQCEESVEKEEVTEKAVFHTQPKPELIEYANAIRGLGYSEIDDEEVNDMGKPYVITPDEYGELDEYDTLSLTLYADGVLTDEQNIVIEDVDSVVGIESLTHFGEYEDDSVFVRNDSIMTDYEILLDERNFKDTNRRPHLAEEE